MKREIVRKGEWLYDGCVLKPAYVVKLDYDFWYEIAKADGALEPGEEPELNEDGALYYICFKSDPEEQPGWVDSQGFKTLKEVSTWAESQVPGGINWSQN